MFAPLGEMLYEMTECMNILYTQFLMIRKNYCSRCQFNSQSIMKPKDFDESRIEKEFPLK